MRKIAYIGQKGIPTQWGGVERATEEFATRMAKAGYDVTAYCRAWYTKRTPIMYHGVKLVYIPSIRTKHLDAITHTFFSVLHALWHGVDVIHFQGSGPAILAWIPYFFSRRTTIYVTIHCLDRRLSKWGVIARAAFWFGEFTAAHCASTIFVTSHFLQNYVYEVWKRTSVYTPNGVFSSIQSPEEDVLGELGVPSGRYILSVGRFISDKAQLDTVKAFELLQKTYPDHMKNISCVLVGDGDTRGEYSKMLSSYAEKNGSVKIIGPQTAHRLRTLMQHALCGVHASHSEGMPIVVLEFAGVGTPLVLSDIPAHREIFGETKKYFTAGDVMSLADLIHDVMSSHEVMRAEAAAAAAQISEKYSWDMSVARYHVVVAGGAERTPLRTEVFGS